MSSVALLCVLGSIFFSIMSIGTDLDFLGITPSKTGSSSCIPCLQQTSSSGIKKFLLLSKTNNAVRKFSSGLLAVGFSCSAVAAVCCLAGVEGSSREEGSVVDSHPPLVSPSTLQSGLASFGAAVLVTGLLASRHASRVSIIYPPMADRTKGASSTAVIIGFRGHKLLGGMANRPVWYPIDSVSVFAASQAGFFVKTINGAALFPGFWFVPSSSFVLDDPSVAAEVRVDEPGHLFSSVIQSKPRERHEGVAGFLKDQWERIWEEPANAAIEEKKLEPIASRIPDSKSVEWPAEKILGRLEISRFGLMTPNAEDAAWTAIFGPKAMRAKRNPIVADLRAETPPSPMTRPSVAAVNRVPSLAPKTRKSSPNSNFSR